MARSKQLELKGTVHRCRWCKHPIWKNLSVLRRAGPKCYRMEKTLDELTRRK